MTIGPHVFKDDRRGLWVGESANLTDKLAHFLPRLRAAIPNLTDLFLPPTATSGHAAQVRAAGFFAHLYEVAHARTPVQFADSAVANHGRIKAGSLELDFEGSGIGPDTNMADYITKTVGRVRSKKPNLPLRINVTPFKGQFVPVQLINGDPQLFIIAQAYGGNMDALYGAEDVKDNLVGGPGVGWGIDPSKASIMHAVMCSQRIGGERQVTLPQVRNKGSFYIDDLLHDAGLLPA